KRHPRGKFVTLLTNWCGEFSSQEARRLFSEAGLPTYRTPEGTSLGAATVLSFMNINNPCHKLRKCQ
ncbi:hypothetical protein MJN85_29285, partial [Salmonella enterica subsp. enterica serovar Anatum]|nr:hypothetical protein [Salmonella enterica subsp. enterica serovar Anatum]